MEYLQNTKINDYQMKYCFLIAILFGTIFRFIVIQFPHNYDFDSCVIIGNIASDFGNVYTRTHRYNYGPVFYFLIGILYHFSQLIPNSNIVFRYLIVLMLTLVDILLAVLVYSKYKSRFAACLFIINPISIIITGVHHQFDNIAILLALCAIEFYNNEESFGKKDIVFILLFALSLITKHVFYLFIVWIMFRTELTLKKRLAYTVIPVFLFLLSFAPFFRGDGARGIINNVFLYRSFNNAPLLRGIYELFAVPKGAYFPLSALFTCLFGFLYRKEGIREYVLLYTICVVCFSSAIANQYLVIPMVGLCVLSNNFKYIYMVFIGLFLALESNGLGLFSKLEASGRLSGYGMLVTRYYIIGGYMIASMILFIVAVKYIITNEKVKKLI